MDSFAPFTTSHEFDAPRDLVWAVNTQPEHLLKWMGPDGFDGIHTAMDFRPGGSHHYGLRGPGGNEMWGKQVFREIEPGRKMVYLQAFSDKDGNITAHPMAPTWPRQMLATATFEDAGPGRTRMTISWLPYEADDAGRVTFDAARAGMGQGFAGMWAKLEAYLKSYSSAQ
ncbi:SRPBCC domain-containing protein [Ramlibacter sp. G-1-2-2]|uniref:SRPBCC domain-containing protein n=1 Tax=Ramlibacter agri TaxID=2728837 RepID=A0A848H842_9BURK|nr:SRPBCC domain-containing protein [Ramlibacter agri]NML46637.1 SRPBCC domain-containing protein [Ramlibacter agri]